MIFRRINAFHTILADLALILFITTASLTHMSQQTETVQAAHADVSLALWRDGKESVSLPQWLARQGGDARTVLVLLVEYTDASRAAAWAEAQKLEQEARASGRAVRVSLKRGSRDRIEAALSYERTGNEQ